MCTGQDHRPLGRSVGWGTGLGSREHGDSGRGDGTASDGGAWRATSGFGWPDESLEHVREHEVHPGAGGCRPQSWAVLTPRCGCGGGGGDGGVRAT